MHSFSIPSTTQHVTNMTVPKIGTLIPNRIFVGGITSTTTEEDLRLFFGKFGPVKDVKVICDRSGLSKGNYGFVTFENQETAERIIKNEGESLIFNDRKLNIGHAVRKQTVFQQDGSAPLIFSNTSIPITNGLSYIPVNGQAVQIQSNNPQNVFSPAMVLPQASQPCTSSLYGSPAPPPTQPSGAFSDMCSIPMHVTPPTLSNHFGGLGGSLIPAGSLLYIHTPVIIPNLGIAGSAANAIEVIYPPPLAVNCVHDVCVGRRSDASVTRMKDSTTNQKVQTPLSFSKHYNYQHSEEIRTCEPPTPQQPNREHQQMSLWQKLVQNGEHVMPWIAPDHSIRKTHSSTDTNDTYADELRYAGNHVSPWSPSTKTKLSPRNEINSTQTTCCEEAESRSRIYGFPNISESQFQQVSSIFNNHQSESLHSPLSNSATLHNGRGHPRSEPSLFQRWTSRMDDNASKLFQSEGCAYNDSLFNNLPCSLSSQLRNMDLTVDAVRLSEEAKTTSFLIQASRISPAQSPVNGANACGDSSARRLP